MLDFFRKSSSFQHKAKNTKQIRKEWSEWGKKFDPVTGELVKEEFMRGEKYGKPNSLGSYSSAGSSDFSGDDSPV